MISFEKPADRADEGRREAMRVRLDRAGIGWHPLRYHKSPSAPTTAYDIAAGAARAVALVRRHRLNVVHARSYVAAAMALAVKRAFGTALLFDMRGFWADERVAARRQACGAAAPCRPAPAAMPICTTSPADFAGTASSCRPWPTRAYRPSQGRKAGPVTIGWIGSPSMQPNLRPLQPMLQELVGTHKVRIRVAGAGAAAAAERFDGLDLVKWTEASEIAEVQAMDIGIMSLADRPFERGKSGYRLAQFMACSLPVVASAVGVNREMVREGVYGFLASSDAEWRGRWSS